MKKPVRLQRRQPLASRIALGTGTLLACVVLAGPVLGADVPAPDGHPTEEHVEALLDAGDYAAAVIAARELLAEVEGEHGRDSLDYAGALDLLAKALRGAGRLDDETIRVAELAVSIKKARLGPEDPEVAASLGTLGLILQETRSYTAARTVLEEALAIQEAHFGPDDPFVATALNNLATVLRRLGAYDEARRAFERALAIREEHLGPEHFYVATTLNNLAMVLQDAGDYAAARPLFERSLEIREKQLEADHPSVAIALNNLARLLHEAGDLAEARPLFERALAIRERRLGPDHIAVATVLNNLASLLHDMGDYAEARPLYERSLAIREKQLGHDHLAVATALTNLASLLKAMGDLAEARRLFERALAIHGQHLPPDHPDLATSLNNLGSVLKDLRENDEARPLLERALAVREERFGPDHLLVATSLNNLAGLLMRQGKDAEAKRMFERALRINEERLAADHPTVAAALNNLAQALENMGDQLAARQLYERALSIRERQLGPDHPLVAASLFNLGELTARSGDARSALDRALHAEAVARAHLQWTIRTLPERQALRYAVISPDGLGLAVSLVAARSEGAAGAERSVWDSLVRSRAVVLDELAVRRRALAGASDPETAEWLDEMAAASRQFASLLVRGPGSDPPERYRALLEQGRRRREIAERKLSQKSLHFRNDLERRKLGFDDVVRSLPAGSALVAYVLYQRRDLPGPSSDAEPGMPPRRTEMSYLAFVLGGPDDPVRAIPLGAAGRIDSLVARSVEEVSQGAFVAGRSESEAEQAYRVAGGALRREVWDPVASHIAHADRVFIVADGALSLVSYGALPVGESDYLVETGPLLHYLSAERDLVGPGSGVKPGRGLLAVGGVAYDEAAAAAPTPVVLRGERASCGDFRSLRFAPLPGTAREAEEVVALWSAAESSESEAAVTVHLTGAAAGEAAFKRFASGRNVLHVATHGFFLGGRGCVSALSMPRGIGGLVEAESPRPASPDAENPLRLSGLVLAGANRRNDIRADEEDGILTAEEIAAMDLSGVEWAVLSACDTGVGEVRAGEGVFGLRRAFRIAGAETLIMSLWPVEDSSAREWMGELYRARLERGLGAAEAAREASLRILRRRRADGESAHPFYWAGFVAAGDWR